MAIPQSHQGPRLLLADYSLFSNVWFSSQMAVRAPAITTVFQEAGWRNGGGGKDVLPVFFKAVSQNTTQYSSFFLLDGT